jgi:hypothetical protein
MVRETNRQGKSVKGDIVPEWGKRSAFPISVWRPVISFHHALLVARGKTDLAANLV